MIYAKGDKKQDNEVDGTHEKSPKKLFATFSFSGNKSCKKSDDYVNGNNAHGNDFFR